MMTKPPPPTPQAEPRRFLDIVTDTPAASKLARVERDVEPGRDIDREMHKQPGHVAYYGMLAAAAYARMKRARYQVHCTREDLELAIRDKAKLKQERITDAAVKARVNRHPTMREAYEAEQDAEAEYERLKVIKEAILVKGEMLRSIGAWRREERGQSEMSTLRARAAEAAAEQRSKK